MLKRIGVLVIITILCVFLFGCISRKDEIEARKTEFKELYVALSKHNLLIDKQNSILDKIYALLKDKYGEENAQKKRWGVK